MQRYMYTSNQSTFGQCQTQFIFQSYQTQKFQHPSKKQLFYGRGLEKRIILIPPNTKFNFQKMCKIAAFQEMYMQNDLYSLFKYSSYTISKFNLFQQKGEH